jgi:integrase
MTEKRKGGRPRKGTLVFTKQGWCARVPTEIDGEVIRVWHVLETDDERVAKRKMAKLVAKAASGAAPAEIAAEAKRMETFAEAASRIVEAQRKGGLKDWKARKQRIDTYALPAIGKLAIDAVRATHVRGVLEAVRDAGKSKQTIVHARNDLSTILGELWREELIPENPVPKVRVPDPLLEATERAAKERAVPTDPELLVYLGWEHPDERFRMDVLERQVMACIARMFGGLRTGDLHAIEWPTFDTEGGRFEWGYAPRAKSRRKGGKPQRLTVPEILRPILRDWWERHGRPTAGPLFPVRRGERVGKAKMKVSHAKAFRRDLARAMGIEVWDPAGRKWIRAANRELSARERVLLEPAATTLPADFHSWRRAYSQALADANVNAQQAKALAGHATEAAHNRYLLNSEKMRAIPEAALPWLTTSLATKNDETQEGAPQQNPKVA